MSSAEELLLEKTKIGINSTIFLMKKTFDFLLSDK